jgi:monoamine oxidase
MDKSSNKPLVVVIGAGVSGLSCAYHLSQKPDCDVIVIEGRDRVGGRTWTRQFGKAAVDCGASWVHGTQGNPVAELAPKIGLEIYQKRADFERIQASVSTLNLPKSTWLAWDEKGNDLSPNLIAFAEAFGQMIETVEAQSICLQQKKHLEEPDRTVEEAILTHSTKSGFQKRWKEKLGEELFMKAWNWRVSEMESYFNAPLSTMSHRWLDDEGSKEEKGGNRHTINGYGVLVQHLASKLNIQLNKKVTSIVQENGSLKLKITTTTGETILADYVVCSIPLGVLKKKEIVFQPKLSERKETAISSLGMGFLNKIVLQFTQVFWPPCVGWMSFIGGTTEHFGDIKSLFKKTGEAVLVFYLTPGVSTKRQREGWTEQETIQKALDVLSYQFGDNPKKFFVTGFATEWQTDPFSFGSYSYLAVGSCGYHYDWLSEPEMNDRLMFAGEATERNSPATVEGAFVSGRREAYRLQRVFKQQRKHKSK